MLFMCFSIFSHRRPATTGWNILEPEHGSQHDPRQLGSSGSSLGGWTGGRDTPAGHHDTDSRRRPGPDHWSGSGGEGQDPARPRLETDDDLDDLDFSWRQRWRGVMTYLIGFGWPMVLLSLCLNVVLGVGWMHAKMSRCARRRKDKNKKQREEVAVTGAGDPQESRSMLPALGSESLTPPADPPSSRSQT